MKHILNNLSDEEKNSILEQHTGGMKVMNENFSKLLNSKLGDVKPLVNEMDEEKFSLDWNDYGSSSRPSKTYNGDDDSDFENDDSDEGVSYDIKSVRCDKNGMEGHVDIDEDDTIIIRYCEGDDESLEYLKRKGKMLFDSKYGRL